MSYDLRLWCVRPPGATATLATGTGWIVNASTSPCLDEDVPDDVAGRLPGIRYLVELSLEPIGAPAAGKATLTKLAKQIARSAHGVIEDPQAGTIELPSGVKRYGPIAHAPDSDVSVLELSWWFVHDRFRDQLVTFVDTLARFLPEAMPRRYGPYEPPEHEYARTGREHFLGFLGSNLTSSIVWYANRPVLGVYTAISRDPGWITFAGRPAFRCNRIAVELDAAVLEQAGWQEGLVRAWREVSRVLAPFFGDVRTLHHYTARGRTLSFGRHTEVHPIKSWWWNGVPPRLGHAAVIGEPYLAAWPELRERTTTDANTGLVFVSTPDWRTADDAADLIGGVPERLAIGFMPRKVGDDRLGYGDEHFEGYADQFPFPRA
jgi:hypothetical protein